MNAMRITLLAMLTVLTVSGCVRSEDALDNAGFSDPVNPPTSKLAIAAPPDVVQEARARSTDVELANRQSTVRAEMLTSNTMPRPTDFRLGRLS